MAFRQVYTKKEVWPKVVLKRLSLSLTHPYHCTKCPQQFHKIYEATEHYLSYHQNSNDLPEKEIQNETKINVRPHKCMGYGPCSAEFQQRSDLRRHIASVHEKIKPHKCPTCGKQFKFKFNMVTHISTVHEGKKPYACSSCDASFAQKSNLNVHIASVHEGKKLYV